MDILNQDGHANDTIFYMRIEAKGGETEGTVGYYQVS